tara:strand:- start:340 stop:717 length:378 start_codon:yes stop_codon:yes gene_type:complete
MAWKDILKNRRTYSQDDLERLAPYWWEDLLLELRDEDEDNTDKWGDEVYQDAWDKYTNDKNWLKNIKWWKPWFDVSDTEEEMREKVLRFDPDNFKDYAFSRSSSYNPNPELRALDRSPPAWWYED